jgi:hypothetical protein
VVLRFHAGIWYAAARLYREFYDRHWPIDRRDAWLWLEDAWQSTIISYPDDHIGYRFRDLPELARQAAAAGIRVLQFDGWDIGGLDRGYPDYRPDPRLGSAADLQEAIAACERLGCRVLLFSNLHFANMETAWFASELHRYTMRGAFGNVARIMGWEYNTVGGLIGHRKPVMAACNPAHPRFAAIMDEAYRGIAALGAAGSQVDKIGGLQVIDYHPDLPADLARDRSWTEPTLAAFARHLAIGRAIRPDYALASETHWDRLFPMVETSYARHWDLDAPQSCGATFPEFKQTCCVTGPTDVALVNNCLRQGWVINVEARHLHAGCGAVPLLVAHIKAVRALRRRLWDLLWLGRLDDPHGCLSGGSGGVLVSRWVAGARQALVLCHFERSQRSGIITLPGATRARLHALDGSCREVALPCEVVVDPDAVIVVECHDGHACASTL